MQDMSQKIGDSQTITSLMTFDWEKVVELTQRAHLDYFAQRVPIDDYVKLNIKINPDISFFYKS